MVSHKFSDIKTKCQGNLDQNHFVSILNIKIPCATIIIICDSFIVQSSMNSIQSTDLKNSDNNRVYSYNKINLLTHWGSGSDNGLSPICHWAIIRQNDDLLSFEPLGIN